MNFSHLANKLRSKITRFSGILSQDLDKTAQRFVREAVYGIMASQSVMLTEIGRQLESLIFIEEDRGALQSTVDQGRDLGLFTSTYPIIGQQSG